MKKHRSKLTPGYILSFLCVYSVTIYTMKNIINWHWFFFRKSKLYQWYDIIGILFFFFIILEIKPRFSYMLEKYSISNMLNNCTFFKQGFMLFMYTFHMCMYMIYLWIYVSMHVGMPVSTHVYVYVHKHVCICVLKSEIDVLDLLWLPTILHS